MSKPYSSHGEPDQLQYLAEENEQLRRLLNEWISAEYIDADGDLCSAKEFAPDLVARSQEALTS